jgi:pyridoxal phosphate enzyme (YggS family)
MPSSSTKHFIGHLQTNKVKDVVKYFDMIQSVDSIKLAEKIDFECSKMHKVMPILIQVNTSQEPQKGGVAPNETIGLVREVAKLSNVKIEGLMTIGIYSNDTDKIRACFKTLKSLFDEVASLNIPNIEMKWLSMGMSEDYQIALEEGANMLRLGRIIFN